MSKRRKRRIWNDDEKRAICGQTRVAGVSVSQVARLYDVNANLVFTWLRDARFVPEAAVEAFATVVSGFLPVRLSIGRSAKARHWRPIRRLTPVRPRARRRPSPR